MAPAASTAVKAGVAAAFAAVIAVTWVECARVLPPYILPSPLRVTASAAAFFSSGKQLGHLQATLLHIGASIWLSFMAGAVLAIGAHYASWSAPAIHQRLSPFLNSFSGIGWTLLSVIWFGVSTFTVIFSISVVLLPFALVNLREGLAAQDRELAEMTRSFGRSRWRSLLLVVLPALMPFAAATLRIMFGVAWKVALTAELFGGAQGLGYLINNARQEYDTEMIFTIILFIILTVYLADRFVFLPLEHTATRHFGGSSRQ